MTHAKKDDIKYEYTETANGFRFTFFRPGKKESNRLTDTDVKVLELLTGNNKLTAKQLSEECQLTERTINRSLKKLKDLNQIQRIGSDKTGYWQILA